MEEEKLAQKKEELEKETRKNNYLKFYERNNSNKKIEFMDIFYSIYCRKLLFNNFPELSFIRKYKEYF